MNKKLNTVLFLIAGTIVNLLITFVFFFVLLFVCAKLIFPLLPKEAFAIVLLVIFILAVATSFPLYRLIVKMLSKRIDFDKYFDPLIKPRKRNRE